MRYFEIFLEFINNNGRLLSFCIYFSRKQYLLLIEIENLCLSDFKHVTKVVNGVENLNKHF